MAGAGALVESVKDRAVLPNAEPLQRRAELLVLVVVRRHLRARGAEQGAGAKCGAIGKGAHVLHEGDVVVAVELRHLLRRRGRRPQHLHLLVEVTGHSTGIRVRREHKEHAVLGDWRSTSRSPQRAWAGGRATHYATMRWCATLIRCGFIGCPCARAEGEPQPRTTTARRRERRPASQLRDWQGQDAGCVCRRSVRAPGRSRSCRCRGHSSSSPSSWRRPSRARRPAQALPSPCLRAEQSAGRPRQLLQPRVNRNRSFGVGRPEEKRTDSWQTPPSSVPTAPNDQAAPTCGSRPSTPVDQRGKPSARPCPHRRSAAAQT